MKVFDDFTGVDGTYLEVYNPLWVKLINYFNINNNTAEGSTYGVYYWNEKITANRHVIDSDILIYIDDSLMCFNYFYGINYPHSYDVIVSRSGSISLHRNSVEVATIAHQILFNTQYKFRVEVIKDSSGRRFKIYIDNILKINYLDGSPLNYDYVGIQQDHGNAGGKWRVDNFTIHEFPYPQILDDGGAVC